MDHKSAIHFVFLSLFVLFVHEVNAALLPVSVTVNQTINAPVEVAWKYACNIFYLLFLSSQLTLEKYL
jgi:hypothetical protein